MLGYGLGLSDQYWLKDENDHASWEDVNYFENDFSPALGELMLPHDEDSLPALYRMIGASSEVLGQSPDAALKATFLSDGRSKTAGAFS